MQRRKPSSARQKKAQMQQKRAVKRGDISPPPAKPDRHKKTRRPPPGDIPGQSDRSSAVQDSSRRLQSSFVKLPQRFLEDTKHLASTIPVLRPIPSEAALLRTSIISQNAESAGTHQAKSEQLTCPKRPKWRYDMTKKEVEKNEEGLFKKWLDQTDEQVRDWCDTDAESSSGSPSGNDENEGTLTMPRAPTSFERNLEVWRQLWRVTEIAQIILILLDSRCPILHYPPSLSAYLSSPHIANRTRTILVLTKVDICGPVRADTWIRYLKDKFPDLRVVQVESYAEKNAGERSGSRRVYQPYLPSAFRQTFVDALKETHHELLQPPERLREHPDRLANWKPPVKQSVDWEAVLKARGGQVGTVVGGATAPRPKELHDDEHAGEHAESHYQGEDLEDSSQEDNGVQTEPEFLTIGLIGQPNVGKSSLLNALFGMPKVKASRTPGKTKHFQTLFWTPEVRLVDCPGLVMPNLIPMETQVLSGILPISRVSAIPLCIHYAAQLLPLERIYALSHPSVDLKTEEDKRTWREPRTNTDTQEKEELTWTAMDILTAYALKKGWVTAKAGRPDVNRAGNAILRALAECKIRWGFWPPDVDVATVEAHQGSGNGIWIPDSGNEHDEHEEYETESDVGSVDEHDAEKSEAGSHVEEDGVEDDHANSEEEEKIGTGDLKVTATAGRFDALLLHEDEIKDEDESV